MTSFPRSARLLKPAELKQVIGNGRRRRSSSFNAIELANPECIAARLGLTVSRKAMPKAVARKRFKRIVRESFRRQPQLPRCDIVIMAAPTARKVSASQLAAELIEYWGRLRERWPVS